MPTPGRSKTRLIPHLGAERAADLSRAFLTDLAATIERVGDRVGARGYAVCSPAGAAVELARILPAIAILNVGGVDVHVQQKAERIDEDVTLAPEDFLARVIAGRIKRTPPFNAPLALWASMIAVVGLASRPAASRLWT